MNITVIGTGYVGLVSGACFSELGFSVTCVDKEISKITSIDSGKLPIYEPGLDELVARNVSAGRLKFSTDLVNATSWADAVFITVGTPTRRGDGNADLSFVHGVAREIATHLSGYTVVVTKSTVPVGTGRTVEKIISEHNPKANFDVVSNPEFLREGAAISDFMRPDRVIVGVENDVARNFMRLLYRPLHLIETPILFTNLETSELIKYASNAFLAVKISYINQMADLCEKVGANVHDVAKGMGLDKRIGNKFLHPGPGYGGSCFPKDTIALSRTASHENVSVSIVDAVISYNEKRKQSMADRVRKAMGGVVKNKSIAILGLSFKPETDDMRESAAINIVQSLVSAGAKVKAYDPKAMDGGKIELSEHIKFCSGVKECLEETDAAVIVTEWNEFRALTPGAFIEVMRGNVVVDLRNVYDPVDMIKAGIAYYSLGRDLVKKNVQ